MGNYWSIYWLTRLDSLNGLATGIGFTCLTLFILSMVSYPMLSDLTEEDPDAIKKWIKRIAIIGLCAFSVQAFIPTQNEAILIVAGGKTLNYVESDTSLQKIPFQATEIISNYMDKKIKELETEKK